MKKLLFAAVAVVVLAGCATDPTPMAPSVLVLPGSTRTFEQFRFDDMECRKYAGMQSGGDSNISLQRRYDYAYQQCMYARGHQVPTAGRYTPAAPIAGPAPAPAAAGTPSSPAAPPPPPAGTPPPPPSPKS